MPEVLHGKGVIAGVAIGQIMIVGQALDEYLKDYSKGSAEEEKAKVEPAVALVTEAIEKSVADLNAQGMEEQAAIMEAHGMLVQDPMFIEAMLSKAEEMGNAPAAVLEAAKETAALFEMMDDDYMRERAADIRDIGKRVAKAILGIKDPELGDKKVILCGHEIEPSVIANIPTESIAGVILGQGSTTCHAVIIAKARAIPTVVGLGDGIDKIPDDAYTAIDGEAGELIINPADDVLAGLEEKIRIQKEQEARYASLKDLPAVTKDGVSVHLAANIGLPEDAKAAAAYGNEGVGLFRSEFVFMGREDIPNEEDQFKHYKEAIEACNGKLCVIRTMDIGGDKPLAYLEIPHEDNPFLGFRAVRISLQRKDLFLPQLKAILRAGVYGKAAIMVPMVINAAEIKQIKAMVAEAMAELDSEGKEYSKDVQVGIMIETPAAAVMTPLLAKYVDFFSIGTNDLVQYTLAVDRVNHNVSYLYNHFNPAVLHLINTTIKAANDNGIWAGMCGEMASDPYAAVILTAMGIDELSMSAPSIPKVKEKIRSINISDAKKYLAEILAMDDGDEIREYLHRVIDEK
ncbi:MAG: phosphoenolpyruvate--protein phosphotransferase [Selenomonadaceae bacterium]|nr:phosphoenolpyruvate--protein phosphotransferase [Selenomonadaceae bacterium]